MVRGPLTLPPLSPALSLSLSLSLSVLVLPHLQNTGYCAMQNIPVALAIEGHTLIK